MTAGTPAPSNVRFGRAATDYARHRAGFPPAFYAALLRHDVLPRTGIVLDVGCGTGTLARSLASPGRFVIGADVDGGMLAAARSLPAIDAASGDPRESSGSLGWLRSAAERLPFADASIDAVLAGQCWHWFDRGRALAECGRVLRRGGTLLLASYDWVWAPDNVVGATEALIESHNPSWRMGGGDGLHPEYVLDLHHAGFLEVGVQGLEVDARYSHEDWRGRIRASAGVGAALSVDRVAAFDAAHAALLAQRFPEDSLRVPHRCFFAWGRRA